MSFIRRSKENKADIDEYDEKLNQFGVITFESDLDLDPKKVYCTYKSRLRLELIFRSYKQDLDFTETNVHGDFSVLGSEFVNFISTVITTRIIRKAKENSLLEEMTYGEIIRDLNCVWRDVNAPDKKPKSDDSYWYNFIPKNLEILEAFGLCEPKYKPNHKRGRPKKEKTLEESKPKRPRGRPRKNRAKETSPKRKRGRPIKNPPKEPK